MIIPAIPLFIGICGLTYFIVALQLNSRFPPFYEKENLEEEIVFILPYMGAVLVLLCVSVLIPYAFILLGLVSAWNGVRVRKRLQKRTNGPLPWLLNPLTIRTINRWPMLVFDTWTIGNTALMGLILFPS